MPRKSRTENVNARPLAYPVPGDNLEMRLRELREHLGLTQLDLARAMGVSQSSVSQLEAQGDVQLSTLRRLANGLGGRMRVSIDLPDSTITLLHSPEKRKAKKVRSSVAGGTTVTVPINWDRAEVIPRSLRRGKPSTPEVPMSEIKELVVKYEMLGEGLQRIVDLYNDQRSER